MAGYHWQREELDYLRDLVGDYPMSFIVEDFNAWAARRGRPQRSKASIARQLMVVLKASSLPTEHAEWLTTRDLAKHLGRCHEAIGIWIRRGFFNPSHVYKDGHGWFVSRDGLRHLAFTKPHTLKTLTREKLLELLEDEELADFVFAAEVRSRPARVPLACIETGEHYPSLLAAAKALGTVPSNISQSIKLGRPAKGFHFREAPEAVVGQRAQYLAAPIKSSKRKTSKRKRSKLSRSSSC